MKNLTIWTVIAAFLLGVFETAVLSHIALLPVLPDLVLLLVLYIALHNGTSAGVVTGFFTGLVFDFLSIAPFGLHAFVFTVLGFLYGLLCGKYNIRRVFFPCLLAFTGTAGKAVLFFVLRFLFGAVIHVYTLFSLSFLFEIVFNMLCAPALFALLGLFPAVFERGEAQT